MNNLTYSSRASSATQASCPAPSLGIENYTGLGWGGEGAPGDGGVRGRTKLGPETLKGCVLLGPPTPFPVLLALPSVPVLLRDCQHRPQLPGGALPVPRGLRYPVLGHPQWGGCLCDSGHR